MAPNKYRCLGDIVSKEDFMKVTTDDRYDAITETIDECCENPHTRRQVEDTLKALLKQVSHKNFPDDESKTYEVVEYVLGKLRSIISDADPDDDDDDDDDEQKCRDKYTYQDLLPYCLDIFHACLDHGPTQGHIQLLQIIFSDFDFDENYIQKLRGDDAPKFFDALKFTYNPNALTMSEDEMEKYQDCLKDFYGDMFRNVDSEDILIENSAHFAGLFTYYIGQAQKESDETVVKLFVDIAENINYKFSSGPDEMSDYIYCRQKNPEILSLHMKDFLSFVCAPGFPKFEPRESIANDWLDSLLAPLEYKIPYAVQNLQMYADLLAELISRKTESISKMADKLLTRLERAGPEVTKNASYSCEKLAAQIEEAGEKGTEPLRDAAKCFVGHKFVDGHIPDGSFLVICNLIKSCGTENCDCAYDILHDKGEKLKWKELGDELRAVLSAVIDASIKLGAQDPWELDKWASIAEWVTETCKKVKMMKTINSELIQAVLESVTHPMEYRVLHRTLEGPCGEIKWESDVDSFNKFCQHYTKAVNEHGKDFTVETHADYFSVISDTLQKAIEAVVESNAAGQIATVAAACMDALFEKIQWAVAEEDEYLLQSYKNQISCFVQLFDPLCENAEHIRKLVPVLMKISKAKVPDVSDSWSPMLQVISTKKPAVLVDYISDIVQLECESGEDMYVYSVALSEIYPDGSSQIHEHLEQLMKHATSSTSYPYVIQLVQKIVKERPEVLQEVHVNLLVELMKVPNTATMVYSILDMLAAQHPGIVLPATDTIVQRAYSTYKDSITYALNILGCMGRTSEAEAEKRIAQLLDALPNTPQSYHNIVFSNIKDIAAVHPKTLAPYKTRIEAIKEKYPLSAENCDNLINVIEGRSLAGLVEEVEEQKADLDDVRNDVSETKEQVDTVSKKVDKQERDIEHVKEDVTKVEERLDDVEETVDDTVQKVEEVDRKTMTNAPGWSRDVSLLLNPESDHDWRLLGQRLGYSNDDIRGWATQHDPCMAVLSEWYATHKTREATHGVLKALEEMNREDAAHIIRKAKEEGDAVLEEEEEESGPLPPVFLSYQWGHQPHVKLLKRHLEGAGFRCWMDTGQMGGGDKLFAKIDAGMRAAAVIVCCVSEKYAKSDNCTREVNLAVNLGKPIIPLLMEKMKWPPEGAMGPIFGEYLFIRFNQRNGEQTGDERFWPAAKFEELLMQLRYSIVPDEEIITDEYRNWWNPKEEQITIPDQTTSQTSSNQGTADNKQDQVPGCEPEVFLSYQWGKQPHIRVLFTRLASLGYSCWMDIQQMGGGDSLYEKIDKGIRSAKVVVCCVTPKYALSANCRREVSLADALKKPIIPLLLDDMTWPPEGPMSMIMTQLVYIGFNDDQGIQMKWTGAKMDELTQKINQHVPRMLVAENPDKGQHDEMTRPPSSSKAAQGTNSKAETSHARAATPKPEAKTEKPKSKSCTII